MTGPMLNLTATMVACGDSVRGSLGLPEALSNDSMRVELRCRLASVSPAEVAVAHQVLTASTGHAAPFQLPVPPDGPITWRGSSLAVTWAVCALDHEGLLVAETAVVVAPRGGMALWLQRHAPPPA